MYPEGTVNQFLDDLASESSIPGGGSAAALAGSMTAAVVSFISNLTIGKKKYEDVEDEAKEILAEAEELRQELVNMVDEDSKILEEILATYKKGDKEELLAVSKKAVEFSMDMTRKCVDIMDLSLHISKIGNRMLASDFEVAAFIGDAAVNSAIANVKINLKSIKDEDYVERIEDDYSQLRKKSNDLKEEIVEIAN
jgi:formiminotetrahydrofolate cyclodeaminase